MGYLQPWQPITVASKRAGPFVASRLAAVSEKLNGETVCPISRTGDFELAQRLLTRASRWDKLWDSGSAQAPFITRSDQPAPISSSSGLPVRYGGRFAI